MWVIHDKALQISYYLSCKMTSRLGNLLRFGYSSALPVTRVLFWCCLGLLLTSGFVPYISDCSKDVSRAAEKRNLKEQVACVIKMSQHSTLVGVAHGMLRMRRTGITHQ